MVKINNLSKNHKTKQSSIPVGKLEVDARYQRPLNRVHVENIKREFDPDKLGLIWVSLRKNGRYYIIDGQHRVAAIREMWGDAELIPCLVYIDADVHDEADLFDGGNQGLGQLRVGRFIARVVAGKNPEVAIDAIVRKAGYTVDRQKAPGKIPAVSALQIVYFAFQEGAKAVGPEGLAAHPELLTKTLQTIRAAFGDNKDATSGPIIHGVGRFILTRGKVAKLDELAHKLAQHDGAPLSLIARARGLASIVGGRVADNVADVLVDIYNSGRRTGKIDPIRSGVR